MRVCVRECTGVCVCACVCSDDAISLTYHLIVLNLLMLPFTSMERHLISLTSSVAGTFLPY